MESYQKKILEKLEKRYGKTEHKSYISQEGHYSNKILTVVYETSRLFRVIIKLNTCEVEILDPKSESNFNEEFLARIDKIGSSIISTSVLSDFLTKNGCRLKSESPLKFSFHTDDYIFSVVNDSVICSLLDSPKIRTIIFSSKKNMIIDVREVKILFDNLLKKE